MLQKRDARSIRIKLDELLRVAQGARPSLVDLDRLSDKEIAELECQFVEWGKRAEAAPAEHKTSNEISRT
jgi:low affinity Fe/Cu permease